MMKAVLSTSRVTLLVIVFISLVLVQRIDGAKYTLRRKKELAGEDRGFWNRVLMTNHYNSMGKAPQSTPSPTPSPAGGNGNVESITVDFNLAAPDNLIVVDSVTDATDAEVKVSVPDDSLIFFAPAGSAPPDSAGSTCPPAPGGTSPATATPSTGGAAGFVTIPLNGMNTIIYVCRGGVIVARCIHVFSSSLTYFPLDFADASASNFVALAFSLPPGTSGSYASIATCTGCTFYTISGGFGGSGVIGGSGGGGGSIGSPGDACPPNGAEIIPNDLGLTLFFASEDTIIYACQNGILVGQCVFTFETLVPSLSPAPSGSSAPSTSITPTLSRSRLNEVITCIAVIDESLDQQTASRILSQWTIFRATYPERPFCLLQPEGFALVTSLFVPDIFFTDGNTIYSNVTREFGDVSARSDWFEICQLEGLRNQGIVDVAIFIDNSGSLTPSMVQPSINLLTSRIENEGLRLVDSIINGVEDWVAPFLTDFD